jgi:hypothetical protein
MSTQLLFYENATPVSSQRHQQWSIDVGNDYGFTRRTNSVPLMAVEFPNAALEYTIVFAGGEDAVMPAAILGVQNDTNLYVDDQGKWHAKYLPAFVRRYPFVFSSNDNGATFTLCIDEAFSGVNQDDRGSRLFADGGERTEYLENVLKFLQDYQNEFQRTQLFCKKLQELGLLEPMQAQIKLRSGQQMSLTGFMTVNRNKLNALEPDKLSELARKGILELAYMHLLSLKNFTAMMERVAGAVRSGEAPAGETDAASASESEADVRRSKKGETAQKAKAEPSTGE